MKIDMSFSALEDAVQQMGAEHVSWTIEADMKQPPDFLIQLKDTGIEIDLDDIEASEDGLLTYRGQQVLLHIKDTRQDHETLLHQPDRSRRFHMADRCRTLEDMRADNRYDRYVVTNRRDGLFLVDAYSVEDGSIEEIEAPLKVCRNCLNALDYNHYSSETRVRKDAIWNTFSIDGFFDCYATDFRKMPRYTDQTFPGSHYTEDWKTVSESQRRQAGWICNQCGVDLSTDTNLAHTHHRNGIKGDNSPDNLEVLCALCHQSQPGHHQMWVSSEHRRRIEKIREIKKSQKISRDY